MFKSSKSNKSLNIIVIDPALEEKVRQENIAAKAEPHAGDSENGGRVLARFHGYRNIGLHDFTDEQAANIAQSAVDYPLSQVRLYRCWEPYCLLRNLQFDTQKQKKDHIDEVHGGPLHLQVYMCPKCKKFWNKRRPMMGHRNRYRH